MLLGAQGDGDGIRDGTDNTLQTFRWEEKLLLSPGFRAEILWVTEGNGTCD